MKKIQETERCIWGDVLEKYHFEDQGIAGRIMLKQIMLKWDGEAWIGLIWLMIGTGSGRL